MYGCQPVDPVGVAATAQGRRVRALDWLRSEYVTPVALGSEQAVCSR